MHRRIARDEADLRAVRELARALPGPTTIPDLEERLLMPSIWENLSLWEQGGRLAAFAFVDSYNNLNFEILPETRSPELEDALVAWATELMRERNLRAGAEDTLDACFSPSDTWQIAMLLRGGFAQQSIRSLRYSRELSAPLRWAHSPLAFPGGLFWGRAKSQRWWNCIARLLAPKTWMKSSAWQSCARRNIALSWTWSRYRLKAGWPRFASAESPWMSPVWVTPTPSGRARNTRGWAWRARWRHGA